MNKFLLGLLAALFLFPSQGNATMRFTTHGNVNKAIVIQPLIFIRGSSEDAKKSRDILKSHPLLQDAAIYERVKNYLEPTLPKEMRENVKFYRWLHSDESREPVDETILIIEVDYMVQAVKIDGKDVALGSITFRSKYPLLSVQSAVDTAYKVSWDWRPQIIFPISDDTKELDKELDKAVQDLFGKYGTSLVWRPINSNNGAK